MKRFKKPYFIHHIFHVSLFLKVTLNNNVKISQIYDHSFITIV